MMNTREEFEKWYDSEFDDGPHYEPTEKAWQACQALNDKRIAELEEKLKATEVDAERYRWLRGSYTHPNGELRVTYKRNTTGKVLLDLSLDDAIDEAREALKTIEG